MPHDARCRVHGNPADVAAPDLNLTCVKTRSHRQTQLLRGMTESQRATNRATGTVECRQDAVTCAFYERAAMLLDDVLCQLIMPVQNLSPFQVSHIGSVARGIDDIGEKHGRQNPLPVAR